MNSASVREFEPAQKRKGNKIFNVTYIWSTLFYFASFFTVPLLFAVAYHAAPLFVLSVTGFLAAMGLMFSLMPYGSVVSAGFLTSIVGGAMGGLSIYYSHAMPLQELLEGRSYNNVYAASPAPIYQDASVISFEDGAFVDNARAVGMTSLKVGHHKYCVAPVVDAQFSGRVQFWAVGVDCCGKLSDFECGDVGLPDVHGALVLSSHPDRDLLWSSVGKWLTPPRLRRDVFMEAIKHAEAVHGVVSNTNPVMVNWSARSRGKLIVEARAILAGDLILAAAVCMVAAAAVAVATQRQKSWQQWQALPEIKFADRLRIAKHTAAEVLHFKEGVDNYMHTITRSSMMSDCLVFGFLVPVLICTVSVVLWSWLQCMRNGDKLVMIFAAVMAALVLALGAQPGRRFYAGLAALAVVAGSYLGHWNYVQNSFNYCTVVKHRSYTNVPAGASSAEYEDAGKLHFEAGASIQPTQSLGFLWKGSTYCAAPIVGPSGGSSNATNGLLTLAYTDFWAVGIDCCGARGEFKCAGDPPSMKNREGLVFRNAGAQDIEYQLYVRAVHAAADFYGLPKAGAPIMMHWGENLEDLRQEWVTKAISSICVVVAASLFFFACIAGAVFASTSQKINGSGEKDRLNREKRQRLEEDRPDAKEKNVRGEAELENMHIKMWYYFDPHGATQGPFASIDMRQWYERSFFQGNLKLRYGDTGEFHMLRELYPVMQNAFIKKPKLGAARS